VTATVPCWTVMILRKISIKRAAIMYVVVIVSFCYKTKAELSPMQGKYDNQRLFTDYLSTTLSISRTSPAKAATQATMDSLSP